MVANFSRTRRRKALAMLRDPEFQLAQLPDGAQLAYAVGLLICDDRGRFSRDDLHRAMNDPSIAQAARTLLAKAGA